MKKFITTLILLSMICFVGCTKNISGSISSSTSSDSILTERNEEGSNIENAKSLNDMEWNYVKSLSSKDSIEEFEKKENYTFPDEFKQCVINNNGGRPNRRGFDTENTKERELKTFLSFNKEDKETMWKASEIEEDELPSNYIPFAIDNYGNFICFNSNDDSVVFFDHESLSIELIANNFSSFINCLYD